jgi:O-antigen ligase
LRLALPPTALAAALLALSLGLVVTAILMTGTRSALIALWLQVLLVWPLAAWRCRGRLMAVPQPGRRAAWVLALLLATVAALGSISSGNPRIAAEARGQTALERGLNRTQSIGPKDESLGLRMEMWRATLNAIADRPLAGLGAGAWEVQIPLYQAEGSQLETDYYVHNEFLQLVAEYGLVGWAFLLALCAWLLRSALRTWTASGEAADAERPWRAALLASLLALFVVSSIGFPWRLATTGALFALCLGALAASDARLGFAGAIDARRLPWSWRASRAALAATAACALLAVYITQRAVQSEYKIVRAAKLALSISASGDWNHPRWSPAKQELLQLMHEGVALNPHYRKITPMAADELARWGDWRNAIWIWESVLSSRPYVVAILSNVARGRLSLGENAVAVEYLERARQIQPRAPAVRALEVIALARSGQEPRALELAREALADGITDFDLLGAAFALGARAGDFGFAEQAMALRIEHWPSHRAASWLQLGLLHARSGGDAARAEAAFRQALDAAGLQQRKALLERIPPPYRQRLAPQTSSSKG